MIVGVPSESSPNERRVALVPASVAVLKKAGLDVQVQAGAGDRAGFSDEAYTRSGARIAPDRRQLFADSGILLQVSGFRGEDHPGTSDLELVQAGQIVVGLLNPLGRPGTARELARRKVTGFALELVPRVSRAQSMDALSAMATVSGYKAAILAAEHLRKMYPMMITAAGTLAPAKVFVIGAGVAGLQAIATSHRLGAVVQAYDVRPAVREQVESVGARFVELALQPRETEEASGYAKALGEEFYARQRDLMAKVVGESDVVITTAAVPGKKAPVLISEEAVRSMASGSVIVDLAAEGGGNCALTRPGETVEVDGVTILGPVNLPATIPNHASQMYSRNVSAFLLHLLEDGKPRLDADDQIIKETLLTRGGEVTHPKVRELLGLSASAVTAAI